MNITITITLDHKQWGKLLDALEYDLVDEGPLSNEGWQSDDLEKIIESFTNQFHRQTMDKDL